MPAASTTQLSLIAAPAGRQSRLSSGRPDASAQGARPLEVDYQDCVPNEDGGRFHVSKWALQDAARRLLPGWRIDWCHRRRRSKHGPDRDGPPETVVVRVNSKQKTAWYGGLHVCGNVWACPVCSPKICNGRKKEVQQAMDVHENLGRGLSLLTLTAPHTRHDPLPWLVAAIRNAKRRLKSGRMWQTIKDRYAITHTICCLEVTHGENGWHVHTHEITFHDRELTDDERLAMRNDIYALWAAATEKEGLERPSLEHGVDVRNGSKAAQYVAKWGIAEELTKSHVKLGKRKGRTPWMLLRDSTLCDQQAGRLFAEFAACFKGRNQLVWSKGLREAVKLQGELFTDEQLAAMEPAEHDTEHQIIENDWSIILSLRARERVLEAAVQGDGPLYRLLDDLRAEARRRWKKEGGRMRFVPEAGAYL